MGDYITFSQAIEGYLLSAKADIDALKNACGAIVVADQVGKTIKIKIGNWRGKPVLRIDPKQVDR